MSRTFVLGASRLAVAAARMKADVNYVGVADESASSWMTANHVFLRDVWLEGELTTRRLQRLYHRLYPGSSLWMDASLGEETFLRAASYARERRARVVLCVCDGQTATPAMGDAADWLVARSGGAVGAPGQTVTPAAGESVVSWAGAMALCLMNGLDLARMTPFCKRAAAFGEEPPWYDEVAYG
ncbi:hypothetical protein FE782_17850 [Paenibacillus antri]|uniref:Uncharacterized protein n=1 Tax=Paenibacillus antri TaxID=2582848 RepID=A0A5R9G555_9BACL|nr:hypothetical protein [Paenibacillus antri]TLS50911.1 hypothetical protein FE782_17850 [Paenibacillus antri]